MPHLVAARHLRGLPSLDRENVRRGLVAKVVLQPFQQGRGPELSKSRLGPLPPVLRLTRLSHRHESTRGNPGTLRSQKSAVVFYRYGSSSLRMEERHFPGSD
jgi:hypothetical protein